MKKQSETFAKFLLEFQYHFDLRTVFNDFLIMSMCAVTPLPGSGKSHYEDLYLETIKKYKDHELRFHFPNAFACLIMEMEERYSSSEGNDILGEFYETNLYRKGAQQYFTPWHICSFMAKSVTGVKEDNPDRSLRILDPTCGSGRMLLAAHKELGSNHEYFGIDIDETCVQMTTLNLFLNGIFHGEVMCANALNSDDFRISYKPSFLPFGIFRIEKKENSMLWHMQQNPSDKKAKPTFAPIESDAWKDASQLQLF
jgi:type I restriction enzyme M protein